MRFSLFALSALLASAAAAPSLNLHVLHEKRDKLPPGWRNHGQEIDGKTILPMKIGLTQGNLENANDYLMEVSHPESPKFGQHWSAKQIAETFAPSQETVDSVTYWLESSGINPERIIRSQSLGWLHFDVTVEEAERLLKTQYHVYRHEVSGKVHVACSGYHVPEHISRHVDFITPTVHFDSKLPMAQEEYASKVKRAPTSTAELGHP